MCSMSESQKLICERELNDNDGAGHPGHATHIAHSDPNPVYPFLEVKTAQNDRSSLLETSIWNNSSFDSCEADFKQKYLRVKSNLLTCGQRSGKFVCLDCSHETTYQKFCGVRICQNPKCVNSRRNRIFRVLWEFHKRYVGRRYSEPLFLTATFKGHRALSKENTDYVHACVSKLLRRFNLSGVYVIENKLKDDGFYFYHVHMLILNSYIPIDVLKSAWFRITKDSFEVKIQRVDAMRGIVYLYQRAASPLNVSDKRLNSAIGIYVKHVQHRRYLSFFGLEEKKYEKTLRELAAETQKKRKLTCPKCHSSNVVLFDYEMSVLDDPSSSPTQPYVEPSVSFLDKWI